MTKLIPVILFSWLFILFSLSCAPTDGELKGTVVNQQTGEPLSRVTITAVPPLPEAVTQTNANGHFTTTLRQGTYEFTFKKNEFDPETRTITIISGQTVEVNISLYPSNVLITFGGRPTSSPGGTADLNATVSVLDGSEVLSYEWKQVSGARAKIENPFSATTPVTLGSLSSYKEELVNILNVGDRFDIMALNPAALTSARTTIFNFSVTTTSGNYNNVVEVITDLPFMTSTGLSNVPVGVSILVHAQNQESYSWSLSTPSESQAALDSASEQNAFFLPDRIGKYTVTEEISGISKDIYTGTFEGVITGRDRRGNPIAGGCTVCHNGIIAPDRFSDWMASGHAAIFSSNLDNNALYSEACLACHTVGFNQGKNGGFDNSADYQAFISSDILGNPRAGNWDEMLSRFPETAKLANVQCENCHGPQSGSIPHPNPAFGALRYSISPGVCGTCHAQADSYGRLQQWQESGHSQLELALEEATLENRGATASNCARCHSGQGFLAWISQEDLATQLQGEIGNATIDELTSLGLTVQSVQPQTCAVCHNPHERQTLLDEPRTATRIMGTTPLLPSGFTASNVGFGAMCITCHNSRNGPHNDTNPPSSYAVPHSSSQGDVFVGENAYFVGSSLSGHAKVADSCAACHMKTTYPPAEINYERPGKDHTFKASMDVCASCHGTKIDSALVQSTFETRLEELASEIGEYLMDRLPDQFTVRDISPHEVEGQHINEKSEAFLLTKSNINSIVPTDSRGQMGFEIKLNNPVSIVYGSDDEFHSFTQTELIVQMVDITDDGERTSIPVDDVFIRVNWNYHLVHYGAGNGMHNNDWVNDVLEASINALDTRK